MAAEGIPPGHDGTAGQRSDDLLTSRDHLLENRQKLLDLLRFGNCRQDMGLGESLAQNGLSPTIPARSIFRTAGQ